MLAGELVQAGNIFHDAALSKDTKATPADGAVNEVDPGFSGLLNQDIAPFQVVVDESMTMKCSHMAGNLFAHAANPVAVM